VWGRQRPVPCVVAYSAMVVDVRQGVYGHGAGNRDRRTRCLTIFFESEVALAAAATAAVCSPRVRGVLRRGLVYGLAGATVAARTVAETAQTAGRAGAGVVPIGNGRSDDGPAGGTPRRRTASARASNSGSPAASRPRAARRPSTARARPAAGAAAAARHTPAPSASDA